MFPEVFLIHFVHPREIVHVSQKHRGLDDMLERGSRLIEYLGKVA